jgi:hypothetical protein
MAVFNELKPNAGSYNASDNADGVRTNLASLRECFIAGGLMPGYDSASGDITYNADGTVATVLYKEQTAIATANGRASGTRYFFRKTHTYTSGNLTKTRYEISANSGSSYSNWVDAAGNAYLNRTYTASGQLDTRTWATS